jgi:DNA-binding beta-propeller fold protein YncE/mono/diheme cytochrome c family protein
MMRFVWNYCLAGLLLCNGCGLAAAAPGPVSSPACLSPSAIVARPDGRHVFIACATANGVLSVDAEREQIEWHGELPGSPSGLALSADGRRLYVTCAGPASMVCVLETSSGKRLATISTGHTAMAPVLSRDQATLFVCNRFDDAVAAIDLVKFKEVARIPVAREPVASAMTPDGRFLLVANHIHTGRSDFGVVAGEVSVIDPTARKLIKRIALPNGSTLLRGICVSPDGRFAAVTHILARYHLPTTHVEHGWMNDNAVSLIALPELRLLNTVLLDDIDRGAANPWGVGWSSDGKKLCVAHAGTHELSVLDVPRLLAKLSGLPDRLEPNAKPDYSPGSRTVSDVPNDLAFLVGLRTRIKLPGNGPRALALVGDRVFVGSYFSDSVSIVDLSQSGSPTPRTGPETKPEPAGVLEPAQPVPASKQKGQHLISVTSAAGPYVSRTLFLSSAATAGQGGASREGLPPPETRGRPLEGTNQRPTLARQGEMFFNDATLCFQGWQSCASCHSSDARVDGMNWDLLNDGIGNPKNVKSLLLAFQTGPAMAMGVRANAAAAVRAGIRHILFSVLPEEYPAAIDEYLKSLKPIPSPHLVKGKLSAAAQRGKKLFNDETVGCAECHPPPLFTDSKAHHVGTGKFDDAADRFYTPTLVEVWRTAPYLHDGSAATLREAITTGNANDRRGKTSHLKPAQIDDLVAYLQSL